MKKLYAFATALLACLSFTWAIPGSSKPLPRKAPPSFTFTISETIDFETTFYIPCADENVFLSGKLHVLYHVTINNNNIVIKSHSQPQGVSGIGTSGEKYQGTGVTQDVLKGSLNNNQFSYTFINNFRLIGQGPGNNYLVHTNLHTTINANGDITVTTDNTSIDCR